jgi:hypothetical protein
MDYSVMSSEIDFGHEWFDIYFQFVVLHQHFFLCPFQVELFALNRLAFWWMHNLSRLEQSDKFGSTSVKMAGRSAHLAGSVPFTCSAALYCLTFVTIAVY